MFKVFVLLFITFAAPNVCVDSVFSHCFVMHYLVSFSSYAIILIRKRQLVASARQYIKKERKSNLILNIKKDFI